MNKFNKRLKELRLQKGLSQRELAKLLGHSVNTIKRCENNETVPSCRYLVKIVNFFKVKCDYLIGLTDKTE